MFGMMEGMISFLRRHVGLRTDAASASGSLHSKAALIGAPNPASGGTDTLFKYNRKLRDELMSKNNTPRITYVEASLGTSYANLINITGSGYLTGLSVYLSTSQTYYIEVVIDGAVLATEMRVVAASTASDKMTVSIPFLHRFNSSLQIRHRANASSTNVYATCTYTLD